MKLRVYENQPSFEIIMKYKEITFEINRSLWSIND